MHLGGHRLAFGEHPLAQLVLLEQCMVQRQTQQLAHGLQQAGDLVTHANFAVKEQAVQAEHPAPMAQRHRQRVATGELEHGVGVVLRARRQVGGPDEILVRERIAAHAAAGADLLPRAADDLRRAERADQEQPATVVRQRTHRAGLRTGQAHQRRQETLQQFMQIVAGSHTGGDLGQDPAMREARRGRRGGQFGSGIAERHQRAGATATSAYLTPFRLRSPSRQARVGPGIARVGHFQPLIAPQTHVPDDRQ